MKLTQSNGTPKIGLLIAVALVLFTLTSHLAILNTSSSPPYTRLPTTSIPHLHPYHDQEDPTTTERCNIFEGEWVPNPDGPYYTNSTCFAIHQHQNCMKYGRPDTEYLRWRWKPHGNSECQLPIFDPPRFLEMVKGKSMAFVGDSVAMNQMQSLICLLSKVEYPVDRSSTDDYYFKQWYYESYNFTLSIYTSTYLVRTSKDRPGVPITTGLHLDEADPAWARHIGHHDYLIISAGHWFFRPLLYYNHTRPFACQVCQLPNVTQLPIPFGYRAVFRAAFRAILDRNNTFKGTVYLRTFAPAHFEGGEWNKGGDCVRRKPIRRNETALRGVHLEMYKAQVEELRAAEREGRERGVPFRLLDTMHATLLRPDGHPSKYGHWPEEKVSRNDCVHWCLPGPIDTWNEFLFEMMRADG